MESNFNSKLSKTIKIKFIKPPLYNQHTNQPLVNQALPPVSQNSRVSKTDFESYAKAIMMEHEATLQMSWNKFSKEPNDFQKSLPMLLKRSKDDFQEDDAQFHAKAITPTKLQVKKHAICLASSPDIMGDYKPRIVLGSSTSTRVAPKKGRINV
ncbi:hypothetical protein Tco_1483343 [Tanacetum coccineum]